MLVGWFSSSAKILFRFGSSLYYVKFCIFITYWSLEAVNIGKSLIITGMTNWNWIKFDAGFCWVFQQVLSQKTRWAFLDITQVSEPQYWCITVYLLILTYVMLFRHLLAYTTGLMLICCSVMQCRNCGLCMTGLMRVSCLALQRRSVSSTKHQLQK